MAKNSPISLITEGMAAHSDENDESEAANFSPKFAFVAAVAVIGFCRRHSCQKSSAEYKIQNTEYKIKAGLLRRQRRRSSQFYVNVDKASLVPTKRWNFDSDKTSMPQIGYKR